MKTMRYLTIGLLLFVSLTALYGGAFLMISPNGETMKMPLEWLKQTPFKDYFIPGLILFCFNGIMSLTALYMVLMRHRWAHPIVYAQGGILIIWILMQMFLIQQSSFLQVIYGAIGVSFLFLGTKQLRSIHH
jgi:hypothetical protein